MKLNLMNCWEAQLLDYMLIQGMNTLSIFLEREGFKETLLKKRLWHRFFPLNFAKFLRTPVLQNNSGRLLLLLVYGKKYNRCTEPDI